MEMERKEQRSSIEGHVENGAESPMLRGDASMEESQEFKQSDEGPGNLYRLFKKCIVNRKKSKFSKNWFMVALLFLLLVSGCCNVYQAGHLTPGCHNASLDTFHMQNCMEVRTFCNGSGHHCNQSYNCFLNCF